MEVNNIDPGSLEKDSGLLKSVRFQEITIDYLYNVVRVHPTASKMPGFQDLMLQGMTYHALSPELKQRLTNEIKPRQRQINTGIVQYTWTISKTQLFTYNASIRIASEKFWLCGYKAYMQLQFYSGSTSSPNHSVYVHLHLHELTNKSYVPLNWGVSSDNNCFGASNLMCNFYTNSSSSALAITFTKSRVGETTSIRLTANPA